MASIIDTTRIVDLPTKASLSEGDVFVVDNENGATSKIPASAVSGSSTAGLVAEEYRDSKTYKVGEYCIHVEAGIPKFYKCTTAIDTAEAWTPAHWEGTDAGTEITDLNQNLTELIKYTTISGTTDSNGILTTSLTTARKIMNAWVDGIAVDRVVFTIVNNSTYKFLVTNAGFTPAANQSYTIAYIYC